MPNLLCSTFPLLHRTYHCLTAIMYFTFIIYYLSPTTRLLVSQGRESLFDLVTDVFQVPRPMPGT